MMRTPLHTAIIVLLASCSSIALQNPEPLQHHNYDVVVYGGTASGVIAAVQASRLGRSVALIEPGGHLGGMTSGGLGGTDVGNRAAIGGLTLEFYRAVRTHYATPAAWVYERPEQYSSGRAEDARADVMWTFEPHVAEDIFSRFVKDAAVTVFLHARLNRKTAVQLANTRIVSVQTEDGRTFEGRVFIDASYEGDLLAASGVSYTVGRESAAQYEESLAGVQTANAKYHQFILPVSAYVVPGNRSSRLLPGVDSAGPGAETAGDRRVQAYNFRLCLTDVPENRIPFPRPADYDAVLYELLFRYFEAGFNRAPWSFTMLPNRKADVNNDQAFSTDFIGHNYAYPDADTDTRERIVQEHLSYEMGLMWTLANHPRVPAGLRQGISRWGLAADEFPTTAHWPHQLYVREARRMIGEAVMTQQNCQSRKPAVDAVGLASYQIDSHHVQRYADSAGLLRNEGDIEVGGFPPYSISYGAIVPPRTECSNLLVPVCLSASHVAYGSIRMEPVFMILGQSAATAASHAIEENRPVQEISYARLRAHLLSLGQVVEWSPQPPH